MNCKNFENCALKENTVIEFIELKNSFENEYYELLATYCKYYEDQ